MNSCENLLFPGSVRRHSQEGRTLFLHLPVQDWSCCLCEHCVAQSKIRAKLGRGSSSVACLPQALFYIFIVQGQKRLLAVLKTEFWLGSPTPHPPPPPVFLSLEGKEATPRSFFIVFSPLTGSGKDPGGEKLFALNIQQQVLVAGSQVPQPIPKLRTPAFTSTLQALAACQLALALPHIRCFKLQKPGK